MTLLERDTAPHSWIRARGLWAFVLIAFGIAWGWEALAYFVLDVSLTNPLVQAPPAFAPAIAALLVRGWVTREGFADAGSRPRFRAAWRFYLIAWLGPLVVAAVVLALAHAGARSEPNLAGVVPGIPIWAVPVALCVLALVTTFAFWGEEFGWTGYLLVRVFPGRPRLAALTAGLVAAIWHYPLALTGYVDYQNLALGLAGWTAWIMCQEVLLAWLRERSGSVWPACLAHAGNNMVLAPLTATLTTNGSLSGETVQLLVVVVLAAIAAGPLIRAGRRE